MTEEEEIVPHGEQDKDVGFEDKTPEKISKPRLHLGWVLGEQLLELVDNQQRLFVSLSPPGDGRHHGVEILDVDQLPQRVGVTRELGSELLAK